MVLRALGWLTLAGIGVAILVKLDRMEKRRMASEAELNEALVDLGEQLSALGVDIDEAATRIETKLEQGKTDLTDELAAVRGASAAAAEMGRRIDALGADAPQEPPVDPGGPPNIEPGPAPFG
jgi:hypothetical protein